MSVASRLNELLTRRAMSVTELQARLEREGVEGSKYSNVRRYVAGEGKSPPPLEWVDGAARALDARAAWLAFGEGEPTWTEEDALRGQVARLRQRFGRPGPDQIVLLVGMGEEALLKPERVVLIDASGVPDEQREAYMRRIASAASEVPPPTSPADPDARN